MTVGLLKRSIREEVTTGKVRPVLETRESPYEPYALSDNRRKPLGQESPIGPCIATLGEWTIVRLVVSENEGRRDDKEMRNTRQKDQSLRPNSWAECREKKVGIEPKESTFLLTFLFIGPFRLPTNQDLRC